MSFKNFLHKNKLYLIAAVVILIIIGVLFLILGGTRGLNKPHSVIYDSANGRYLISNSGNGSIVFMNQKGKINPFVSKGLNTPKGMLLKSPILFVADMENVQAIDMMNERVVAIYPIEGAVSLSGIASDGTDNLYLTDTGANCLFIFNPTTKSLQKITNPLISNPTAIVFDKPRAQMMIVDSGNQVSILTYSIYTQEVSVFMDTAYSQMEGIVIDEVGRIFFSAAKEEMIVMIPQEQNRFVPVIKKLRTPGSFAYNAQTKELVIPLTRRNRILTQKID